MLKNDTKKWKWVKLGEVCDFVGGGTPSKKESKFWNGTINWASVKDVKESYLNSTEDKITQTGLENSASHLAQPNDLILATRILPGRATIANVRTAINQDLKIVKPKFSTSSKFLLYYFQAFETDIISKSSGTTVLGITLNALTEMKIPIIEKELQDNLVSKIEELFSELDKGRQQLETALQQLKVYRQAVLKWAFEGKLTGTEKWISSSLGEICDMKAGFFVKASEIQDELKTGLFPCYGGNGLRGYTKSYTHEGEYSLIGRQGALCGNVHFVSGKFHATEHAVVTTAKANIDAVWLFYKLTSMKLNQYSRGAAQPGLSVNKLLPLEVHVPPLKDQQKIVFELENRLSVCDKLEEIINQNLAQAETLRQSILKKAFEGRLV